MAMNIEERLEKSAKSIEQSSQKAHDFAEKDTTLQTCAGSRDSLPKVSRIWQENFARQFNKHATEFQDRFALSQQSLPWQAGITISDSLQRYHIGVQGEEGYKEFLPNPLKLPFETAATLADDLTQDRWLENGVPNKHWTESKVASALEKSLGVNARVWPKSRDLVVGDVIPSAQETSDGLTITHVIVDGKAFALAHKVSGAVSLIDVSDRSIVIDGYTTYLIDPSFGFNNIRGWGAFPDGNISLNPIAKAMGSFALENVPNPNATDSYKFIQRAIDYFTEDYSIGGTLEIDGAYFSSQRIDVEFRVGNYFTQTQDTGYFWLKGKNGPLSDRINFPSDVHFGVDVNRRGLITAVKTSDFGVYRMGFNESDYLPLRGKRAPNYSDPKFGAGIRHKHNGYIGAMSNLKSEGFYLGFMDEQAYAARREGLFCISRSLIGYWADDSTTIHLENSTLIGYHSCVAFRQATLYTNNVVGEATFGFFNNSPELLDRWEGNGFMGSYGALIANLTYSERLAGRARDLLNCRYSEEGGIVTNSQHWGVYTGTSWTQGFKDKLLALDPNLTIIRWEVDEPTRLAFSLRRCSFTKDEKIFIQDNKGGLHCRFAEVIQCPPAASFEEFEALFTAQKPVIGEPLIAVNGNDLLSTKQSTRVEGLLTQLSPYSPSYESPSGFTRGRRLSNTTRQSVAYRDLVNNDGTMITYKVETDAVGVETRTKSHGPDAEGYSFNSRVRPNANNAYANGHPAFAWTTIFATNGTIQPSDARLKTEPQEIPDEVFLAWGEVRKTALKWMWKWRQEFKSGSDRWHFGPIAQDIVSAFESHGLNPFDYGIICHDKWDDILDGEGNVIAEAGDKLQIRPNEIMMLEIAYNVWRELSE